MSCSFSFELGIIEYLMDKLLPFNLSKPFQNDDSNHLQFYAKRIFYEEFMCNGFFYGTIWL